MAININPQGCFMTMSAYNLGYYQDGDNLGVGYRGEQKWRTDQKLGPAGDQCFLTGMYITSTEEATKGQRVVAVGQVIELAANDCCDTEYGVSDPAFEGISEAYCNAICEDYCNDIFTVEGFIPNLFLRCGGGEICNLSYSCRYIVADPFWQCTPDGGGDFDCDCMWTLVDSLGCDVRTET